MKNWVAEGIASDVNDFSPHQYFWHFFGPAYTHSFHIVCSNYRPEFEPLFFFIFQETRSCQWMATLRRVCHTLKLLLFSRGFVQEKSPYMSHAETGIPQSKPYFLFDIISYHGEFVSTRVTKLTLYTKSWIWDTSIDTTKNHEKQSKRKYDIIYRLDKIAWV